jgi:hypothetical protein
MLVCIGVLCALSPNLLFWWCNYSEKKEDPAGLTEVTAGRGIRGRQERFIAKVFDDLREERGQDESKLRDIKVGG